EPAPEPEAAKPRRAPHSVEREPPRSAPLPAADELAAADANLDAAAKPSSNPLGTAVVGLLLIITLGLVGASLAMKQTADPRPLLVDLYKQYMQ
ncbi:MAG: hypothetical protein AAGA54_05885, partial [Myxococcota bacterium]